MEQQAVEAMQVGSAQQQAAEPPRAQGLGGTEGPIPGMQAGGCPAACCWRWTGTATGPQPNEYPPPPTCSKRESPRQQTPRPAAATRRAAARLRRRSSSSRRRRRRRRRRGGSRGEAAAVCAGGGECSAACGRHLRPFFPLNRAPRCAAAAAVRCSSMPSPLQLCSPRQPLPCFFPRMSLAGRVV